MHMIPEEAKALFDSIIKDETFRAQKAMAESFSATQARLASHGILRSGRGLVMLKEDAAQSLQARARMILITLLRCVNDYRVMLDQETVTQCLTIIKDGIEAQAQMISSHLFALGAFASQVAPKPAVDQVRADLAQEGPRLIERMYTEFKLAAVAAANATQPAPAGTMVNFNAPVTNVVTGSHNQVSITNTFDAGSRERLIALLDEMARNLQQSGTDVPDRDDLLEVISDAKVEAEKPKSNLMKLEGYVRAIATAAQTTGSLASSYEAIKPIAAIFGIALP